MTACAAVAAGKPEIVDGVSYVPQIDPDFSKYETMYKLVLNNILLTDIYDGVVNDEGIHKGTFDMQRLQRTDSVTLPTSDVLVKLDKSEEKMRKKCSRYLKRLINWQLLKKNGLVGLKLRNKAIKIKNSSPNNQDKDKNKKIKYDEIGQSQKSSRKRSRSKSPQKVQSSQSSSKSNEKEKVEKTNVVQKEKKQKVSSLISTHQTGAVIKNKPLPLPSKSNNNGKKKIKHFISPKKTQVDLKKNDNKPKIINPNPTVTPSHTLPSSTSTANINIKSNSNSNYKIPKKEKKPQVPIKAIGKEKAKPITIANLSELDTEKYVQHKWTEVVDSDDDEEKGKEIRLRPDPTIEEMSDNIAFITFEILMANPEKMISPADDDKVSISTDDDGNFKGKVQMSNNNLMEAVGRKIVWWVLKDCQDPSEYPPFECPEYEEDEYSTVSTGDDDDISEAFDEDEFELDSDEGFGFGGDQEEVTSIPEIENPFIAFEYRGQSLLTATIGPNKRDVKNTYFRIINVKPGTNYERSTFEAECLICHKLCPDGYALINHLKTDKHRKKFADYSFELATDEEKIFAAARDFDELKKNRREKRRKVRREFKVTFEKFFEP